MKMCLVDSRRNILSNNIKRKKCNFAVENNMRNADVHKDVVGNQKSWKKGGKTTNF